MQAHSTERCGAFTWVQRSRRSTHVPVAAVLVVFAEAVQGESEEQQKADGEVGMRRWNPKKPLEEEDIKVAQEQQCHGKYNLVEDAPVRPEGPVVLVHLGRAGVAVWLFDIDHNKLTGGVCAFGLLLRLPRNTH